VPHAIKQAQKLEKGAHAGLPCEGCHEGHETYPHPANLPKPVCTGCHADQASDYTLGIHGRARKNGNEMTVVTDTPARRNQ
jgi:hypothetical protein